MGILNSFHRFAAPAFAPVLLNLTMVAFSFLGNLFGDITRTLAAGVVAGGLLQLSIQIPPLLRAGWRIRPKLEFHHPGVRRVAKRMVPVIFGAGIVQVNVLVDTQFASYLQEGSVTAIYYADRVMELVLGGYAVAVSTVILPLLSRQAARREMDQLKATLNFASRLILFITFPATVGLIVLRREIIEVLFQHGDFDATSTALTAWALPFFSIGLSAFAMVKIIVPAFYALEDARTPVKVAFVAMVLNVALNFLFIHPLRNGGPALATSLSALFNSLALLTIFHKRYGSFGVRGIMRSVCKFAVASFAVAVVAYVMIHWPGFYGQRTRQRVGALSLTIASAAATYFGASRLMRSREMAELRLVRGTKSGALETG
jgi:putative peptidoglycan lipid II flippase